MIRFGVLGCEGHVGRLVVDEISKDNRCVYVGGVSRKFTQTFHDATGKIFTSYAREVIAQSDAIIDFTISDATPVFANLAREFGKPFMSGTTGLTEEHMTTLNNVARTIPVLHAVNTTPSFHKMAMEVERAAMGLAHSGCAVEITETHREGKNDVTSGSALFLAKTIRLASAGKLKPKIESIREGDIAGVHEVVFKSGEKILFHARHEIKDRREFARGAIEAALWLSERKRPAGFYGMEDILRRPVLNAGN